MCNIQGRQIYGANNLITATVHAKIITKIIIHIIARLAADQGPVEGNTQRI